MNPSLRLPVLSAFAVACAFPLRGEAPQVEWRPVSFSTGMEIGQMVKGEHYQTGIKVDGTLVPRTGVALTHHALIGRRLDVQVGVGGIFWYGFPEEKGSWWTQGIRFGPGISVADGRYAFGDPEDSRAYLQFGYFPMKYNPEAANLGEYLFRAGTYPGYLWTGGWKIVDNAAYMAQGLRLHLEGLDGALRQDFTVFMERDFAPFFDFTPSYVTSLRLGMLEIGGGISFNHYLPIRPSQLAPRSKFNNYVTVADFPAVPEVVLGSDTVQRAAPGGPRSGLEAELENITDAAGGNPFKEKLYANKTNPSQVVAKDSPEYQADPDGFAETSNYRYSRGNHYFTSQGIKLMARFSLDFRKALGLDLRLFAEAALLGVEDQPYYYEDKLQRIPVMGGLELPTFGLLDRLNLQAEYYAARYPNSIEAMQESYLPVWKPDLKHPEIADEDNWRWSILAKRNLVPGHANVFFQVASDHLRLIDWRVTYSHRPITSTWREWYYFMRLEFGV